MHYEYEVNVKHYQFLIHIQLYLCSSNHSTHAYKSSQGYTKKILYLFYTFVSILTWAMVFHLIIFILAII